MEWSTEPLDLQWLASIEADAEGRHEAVKRLREAEKGQRSVPCARRLDYPNLLA